MRRLNHVLWLNIHYVNYAHWPVIGGFTLWMCSVLYLYLHIQWRKCLSLTSQTLFKNIANLCWDAFPGCIPTRLVSWFAVLCIMTCSRVIHTSSAQLIVADKFGAYVLPSNNNITQGTCVAMVTKWPSSDRISTGLPTFYHVKRKHWQKVPFPDDTSGIWWTGNHASNVVSMVSH